MLEWQRVWGLDGQTQLGDPSLGITVLLLLGFPRAHKALMLKALLNMSEMKVVVWMFALQSDFWV